jgi:hypothetical protein
VIIILMRKKVIRICFRDGLTIRKRRSICQAKRPLSFHISTVRIAFNNPY